MIRSISDLPLGMYDPIGKRVFYNNEWISEAAYLTGDYVTMTHEYKPTTTVPDKWLDQVEQILGKPEQPGHKMDLKYFTKDSGQREDFSTGARRDIQDGKPRFELIPAQWLQELANELPGEPDARLDLVPIRPLLRVAALYGRGAKKYGEGNYQKGIPFKRVIASLLRHVYSWVIGQETGKEDGEDHLAAAAWNAFALMYYEPKVCAGELPKELNDYRVLQ